MVEAGFIKAADGEKAKRTGLGVTTKAATAHTFSAEYFAEEVRRELYDRYGEKKLYEGGLSVRTTLDTKYQVLARKALTDGLVKYDEARGWRGPIKKIDISGDWGVKLAEVKALNDVAPWRAAVVLEVGDHSARIGLQPGRDPGGDINKERDIGIIPLDGMKWAKTKRQAGQEGRATWSSPATSFMSSRRIRKTASIRCGRCRKYPARWWWKIPRPAACSRWSVASPTTRASSTAPRRRCASPAPRSSRSSMPPPSTTATRRRPWCSTRRSNSIKGPGQAVWKPENYEGNFFGPSTLRFGIEHSRNVMTVRLAQDIGMPLIAEYAKRFGVYDSLPPYLSFALGAGETTLLRMVTAYAMLDNGGKRVKPTLIDRIQDRYGHTVYRHDERECIGCDAKKWDNQPEPSLIDRREQVIDPMTAYQITSMMEGVVQRGTAANVGFQKEVGKPVAGKTGTTNDYKDAWFIGFTPDVVVGVYIGYDKPRSSVARPPAADWRRRW